MIRKWLAPPHFADEEMNRRASVLNTLLWPTTFVGIAIWISQIFSRASLGPMVVTTAEALICVLSIYLLRRGHVRATSMLFIFTAWLILILGALAQDSLTSPLVWLSMVILMQAGLVLERRYWLILTIASIVAALLLYVNTVQPFMPQLLTTPTPVRRLVVLIASYLILNIIMFTATNNLNGALKASQSDRKHLEETNRLLQETQAVLEKKVEERTAALEQRAGQLQAAVEVAAAVTSIRDLPTLLDSVTGLVAARFGYYHAGIYLPDAEGKRLVLRSASSQMGRELIQNGFSLGLDEATMATSTARTREARVAADVRTDEQYRSLDALSLTQSEITLALLSGEKLLGVLDLQDERVKAPSSEEMATLRMLANQTAVAIDNAQLLETSRQSLDSMQRAYGTMSREGWQKVLRTQTGLGYRSTQGGQTLPESGDWKPEMAQAQTRGEIVQADSQTLAVPIKIRDQVVGVVRLCKPEAAGVWRGDEITLVQTLSDRLSAALEGARLYEETRRRAERERLTGEITARMRASNDPQTILEVAARELRKALQADKAQLVVQAAPVYTSNDRQTRDGGSDGHSE